MKKNVFVCTYINSRGNTRVRYFETMEAGLAFCDILDKRIQRGTCGGYSFTTLY